MKNAVGMGGFVVMVLGIGLYDYRMALIIGGGLSLVAAITGMILDAYSIARP